jgi:hypothetical protein
MIQIGMVVQILGNDDYGLELHCIFLADIIYMETVHFDMVYRNISGQVGTGGVLWVLGCAKAYKSVKV